MANMDAPTRASRVVAIAILVLGPLAQLATNGPQVLGSFPFWFGLYGWLSAAIAIGYVAYVLTAALGSRRAGME